MPLQPWQQLSRDGQSYLIGTFPVEFLLILVPLHQFLHECERHLPVVQLWAAVFILNGWEKCRGGGRDSRGVKWGSRCLPETEPIQAGMSALSLDVPR